MDSDGDSFDDCLTKCTRSIDREADDDDRSKSSLIIRESDCECYCSMSHDLCNEEPTAITGM